MTRPTLDPTTVTGSAIARMSRPELRRLSELLVAEATAETKKRRPDRLRINTLWLKRRQCLQRLTVLAREEGK